MSASRNVLSTLSVQITWLVLGRSAKIPAQEFVVEMLTVKYKIITQLVCVIQAILVIHFQHAEEPQVS